MTTFETTILYLVAGACLGAAIGALLALVPFGEIYHRLAELFRRSR